MKKFKTPLLMFLICIALFSLSGCAKKTESLAYIHEPTKEILSFYDDGTAEYKGNKYKFKIENSVLYLTSDEGTIGLRFINNGDEILLYEKSTYQYDGEKNTDGIVGVWKQDNGWAYVFTEDGKFSEEGIFFGHYAVDEQSQCIKLMYDDPIEDAYLYYELDGDKLVIDYPWPVVETQKTDTSIQKTGTTAKNN